MRILHLIDSSGVYGAERILVYLAREQQRQGHAAIIGSISRPGTGTTAFEAVAATWGLTVVPIRVAPRPTPAVVRALLGAVRALHADVVHSHGYKANILLGPLPRRIRGPMTTTLHGWTGGARFSAKRIYEALDKWALQRIESVTVVARSMLKLPAVARLASVRLIENGIPSRESRLEDLLRQHTPALPVHVIDFMRRRPTLLAIGRLSAEKGFAVLLEAFARADAAAGAWDQLVVVGEGPERAALESRIAALGLQERVLLPGYLEGAERLLAEAAGFVMSSLTEGMPVVLLEAMQWQVPILATRVGAIPELLDEGSRGQLVAPGNVPALAAGLRELAAARDSTAVARVGLAYAAVCDHYSSVRMASQYLTAYREIA